MSVLRGDGPYAARSRPAPVGVGIVLVLRDDPAAPYGSASLYDLRGDPLLAYAVRALAGAGSGPGSGGAAGIGSVVVTAPPELEPAVRSALGRALDPASGTALGPVPGVSARLRVGSAVGFLPLLRAALDALPGDVPVVVHDPRHPLTGPDQVAAVLAALLRDESGPDDIAVPLAPVTDTLKAVDQDGLVLATVDRRGFLSARFPQAARAGALIRALAVDPAVPGGHGPGGAPDPHGDDPGTLPRLVRAAGGRVVAVPAEGHDLRIRSGEEVTLASALLDVAGAEATASGLGAPPAAARPAADPPGTSP